MFLSILLTGLLVGSALAAPAPVSQDAPCVPQYNVPGLSKEYSTIPLGPGMHYCDGSTGGSTSSGPPTAGSHSMTSGQSPAADNTSSTNPGSSTQNPGSTGKAAGKQQAATTTDDGEEDDYCDEGGEGEDSTPSSRTGSPPPAASSSGAGSPQPATTSTVSNTGSGPTNGSTTQTEPNTGGTSGPNSGTGGGNSSTSSNAPVSGHTFQATITGYGGTCGSSEPACGFLGSQGSYQGAVSAYWNTAGLPGQCGTCWQLNNGTKIDGSKKPAGPIGTDPIVVMIDNTCAPDKSKPGFQCNQNAGSPTDMYGSVTVVDLCMDTGASDAFFGSSAKPGADGHRAGLAIADITQVDCGSMWKGNVDKTSSWTKYQASKGTKDAVKVKPGHSR